MRAVQFLGNRESRVIERPDPKPQPGQVIVDMRAAAICGSDLHRYRHNPPEPGLEDRIPGHEPVGVVSELGEGVTDLKVGQRVLVYHRIGCGTCKQCRTGNTNICSGVRPDWPGCDCDRVPVFAKFCFPMPDDMSWDTAVVIACQGGTAYTPLRGLGASGRDTIVVTGLGGVGLNMMMFGSAMGARMIGIDPMPERRELALRFGASAVIDPTTGDPGKEVAELTSGGADAMIETSGHRSAHAKMHEYLRTEGTAVIVGLGNREPSVNPVDFYRKQLTMRLSNLYPEWLLPEIVNFVRTRNLPIHETITHRFPLSEAPAAFQLADTFTTGKIIFTWDD